MLDITIKCLKLFRIAKPEAKVRCNFVATLTMVHIDYTGLGITMLPFLILHIF